MNITRIRTLLIALVSAIAFSTLGLSKGFNPGDFQEDADKPAAEVETPTWPEAEFDAPQKRAKAFRPGEIFKFRAQWGFFRKAGKMTIATTKDENDNIVVSTETNSHGLIRRIYPMWLKAKTVLDPTKLRMVTNIVNGKARSEETESETTFDYEKGVMVHKDKHKPGRNGTKEIPYPVPLDYASALLQMRSWELAEGKVHPLLVSSRGKFYYVELEVKELVKIKSIDGEVEAYLIEPVKAYPQSKLFREGGKFSIWVSADEKRIPLRLDVKTSVGTASMRLEDYKLSKQTKVAAATMPPSSSS
ncbi:MAG: DUF3108 domain-containing protein [Verrucomicrobiota bacterium]